MSRALLLAAGAFVVTIIFGRYWLSVLQRYRIGKRVRVDGPQSHLVKTGTLTMGGLMIIAPVIVLTMGFNLVDRWSMVVPLVTLILFGLLGAVDDYLSLERSAKEQYGFSERVKLVLQIILALGISLALYLPQPFGLANSGLVRIPFLGSYDIGFWFFPVAAFIIVATSNAVNLTDGLDGLAGWNLAIAFSAYGVITFLSGEFTNLMTLSFTVVGACVAFLWYNAHPAQVFMGDLGSMALGAVLAVIALQSQQWLLLPLIGVVFVGEALSSVIQKGYYKYSRWRTGTPIRVFRMAPLHHHFELGGWSETQITQRFVLITMIATLIGVSLALTFQQPHTAQIPVAKPQITDSETK
ncbi:MAG: phospho-N-acetylmuramoyl-pentapeptide-transferase [Chloroflexales bacterium]|nr:phospho-N-acetylmuramoyl-pentapeptide-transferase [Chloroflexales bacterium]